MTFHKRLSNTIAMALAALVFTAGSLTAQGKEAFTEERFEGLQAEGALILVNVHADWCPTCRTQQGVLEAFHENNPGSDLFILTVDYDNQKEWVKFFGAPSQSTLVLYRGEERLWFSVGETGRDVIYGQIAEAASAVQ